METIPEEEDEYPQMSEKEDIEELDTIEYAPEESDKEPFNTAIDDTSEDYSHGQTGHHCICLR